MQHSDPHFIRAEFETWLREYWVRQYVATQQGADAQERFLDEYTIPHEAVEQEAATIPPGVRDAYAYYLGTVEAQDWGSVRLYRVPVGDQPVYAVRVTTDGDDGWLELYDEQGTELGVGRTYLELVGWGDRATIRAQVQSGEFPPQLSDRATRTLWGK
jgi:hypothetical protein